ncbi:MAG: adenine nucleotide alpha hydrolase [Granulosicoccaceae bacterium]|jgi:uncharacterized protein (TIGR00290 family)
MSTRTPVLLSWSSGKDSAWTLHSLRQRADIEVVGLVTTLNESFDRVAMHAVRRQILEQQAEAAGLPLYPIHLPWPCANNDYERIMSAFIQQVKDMGIRHMAFGDLFLEDIRAYREQQLADTGITPLFPLWQTPTQQLAHDMIDAGLVAHLSCVDPRIMPAQLAGRRFDHALLAELPAGVDPCGEHGEFHTCVTDGPMFQYAIEIKPGEVVERDGFVFADLQLSDQSRILSPRLNP